MENFIVSARKYRPQEFDSVVGQSHITDTLEHAIENNHSAFDRPSPFCTAGRAV